MQEGVRRLLGVVLSSLPISRIYTGEGAGHQSQITAVIPLKLNTNMRTRFTTIIRAVVLATNNDPMIFTSAGGVSRRRVIFNFDNIVPENEKTKDAGGKIDGGRNPRLSAICWLILLTLKRHACYYWNSVTVMKLWQ